MRTSASDPHRNNTHILIIEDTEALAALYENTLVKAGYEVTSINSGEKADQILNGHNPDLILLDMKLPDIDGIEFLKNFRREGRNEKVIIMTGYGSLKNAIEAMRYNASDFLVKPFTAEKLLEIVNREINDGNQTTHHKASDHNWSQTASQRSTPSPAAISHFQGFTGQSAAMRDIYDKIKQAARSDATVFITGESGTGKDICAEAIHNCGLRANHPFIAINCAAIPRDLMESELFGHVKGAFTGAVSDREGAVSMAYGGTLFLDEIAEMHQDMQTKLLRFLQNLTFTKVGSTKQHTTDIRIICATNRNPMAAVKNGTFREDLFYRLHVIPIHMPPLRERNDDAVFLAETFLTRFAAQENKTFETIDSAAKHLIRHYHWPGNVRQLQNEMRRITVMHDPRIITPAILSSDIFKPTDPAQNNHRHNGENITDTSILPLAEVEQRAIERAILICGGNIPKAAAALGVSPSTIYRKRMMWENSDAESINDADNAAL